MAEPVRIEAAKLTGFMARLYRAAGLSEKAAATMAGALVSADLQGLPSHGVMQSEAYLARLRDGTITTAERATIVVDREASVVLDAGDMLGHLAADQAMALAVERARRFGTATVAVRNGAHLGAAGRYALAAARAGCVGIAMANTRPIMPAPGGAEKMVGTNPLAIAIPTAEEPHIVLDMATTEGSVGKLRIADKAGTPIPPTWAVAADGSPTTDPKVALAGMLLPSGGAKGFGLSFVIDLLAGLLASGNWGDAVNGMREDASRPIGCSHLFIAIDVPHFRPLAGFAAEASKAADRVRKSRRAPGVDRIHVPGEGKWNAERNANGIVGLEPATAASLRKLAAEFGVSAEELTFPPVPAKAGTG